MTCVQRRHHILRATSVLTAAPRRQKISNHMVNTRPRHADAAAVDANPGSGSRGCASGSPPHGGIIVRSRIRSAAVSLTVALAAAIAAPAGAADWKPTRPINLIVPWAAGGSTDQVTRVTAAELEKVLGQTIVVVNQPGASGSIGTKSALDAAKDGYTWTAGAAQDLGTYETLGSLKTRITDWNLFLNVANYPGDRRQPELAVQDRQGAARRDEGQAGPDHGRHRRRHLGRPQRDGADRQGHRRQVPPRHLRRRQPGGGGHGRRRDRRDDAARRRAGRHDPRQAPAAAGHGERQAARARGLRHDPAAVGLAPRLHRAGQLLRHLHSEGRAGRSRGDAREGLGRQHRQERGAEEVRDQPRRAVRAVAGDAAQKAVFPAVQANAWLLYDSGKAKVSPDTVGIPKP